MLELLREQAAGAEFYVLESPELIRLIWDYGQDSHSRQRLRELRRELRELMSSSPRVVRDDGFLHVEISVDIVSVEYLESQGVEEL